jgi:CRISPR-associated protein Cas1
MSGLTVLLDRKCLVVRMDSKSIRVESPDGPLERIPLAMVDRVIVMGAPMVSCDVWRALAEQNIPAVLLPLRGRGMPAFVSSGLSATITTRMAQYKAIHDDKCSQAIRRRILDEKLRGQEAVIKRAGNERLELLTFCGQIKKQRIKLRQAEDRNRFMGYEGIAANAYFNALAKIIPKKWKFSGRNRRPPRDPVNALLSLSYVLAEVEIRNVVHQVGLDSALGFLHALQPGRESLVLDILEPLRPRVDWFVLGLLDNPLNLKHFTTNEQDGCLLNKQGRKYFFKAWALWQESGENKKSLKPFARGITNAVIGLFPDVC